tara:strand:- start:97264 stop:99015 length:1752 start_codon:yes stop_codon:yes gene_type:complete
MNNWRVFTLALPLWLVANGVTGADESRRTLDAATLLGSGAMRQAVPMAAFTPGPGAGAAGQQLQGLIDIFPAAKVDGFRVLRDDLGYASDSTSLVTQLPAFSFTFVQQGDQLIPATRGVVTGDHPHWEWLLEPGLVWQEAGDRGYSRVALPFSLVQRGENCTHNGVMSFLFKSDGSVSRVALQVASETCLYFKFDLWTLTRARFTPGPVADAETLVANYAVEVANRLPVRPIEDLAADWPGANPAQFGAANVISPDDMTVYGFLIGGVNYLGGCQTRQGRYPFCEVLDLPSYSLAKSLVAGLGLMRLEQLYPGAAKARIADYVPECAASGTWHGVTFEHALDMATGNYSSADYDDDETAGDKASGFFDPVNHSGKISFACGHYPHHTAPGQQWVYHTSDTYVLGTAMNGFLTERRGMRSDLLDDLLLPWWRSLSLSPTSAVSRRSYDEQAQAFTGYGLTLHVDDIAKLADLANSEVIRQQVDSALLNGAMQRNSDDPGLPAMAGRYYYNNGFWAYPGVTGTGCTSPINLPFMLGYGGINVVLLPNNTVYYYFSDSGQFSWLDAARESDRIIPFCSQDKEQTDD